MNTHLHRINVKLLLLAATSVCGILGLILFRWTPTTLKGTIIYVALLGVLVVLGLVLAHRKRSGYWPGNADDR